MFSESWASGVTAGPPDEAGQVVHFEVVSNRQSGLVRRGAVGVAGGGVVVLAGAGFRWGRRWWGCVWSTTAGRHWAAPTPQGVVHLPDQTWRTTHRRRPATTGPSSPAVRISPHRPGRHPDWSPTIRIRIGELVAVTAVDPVSAFGGVVSNSGVGFVHLHPAGGLEWDGLVRLHGLPDGIATDTATVTLHRAAGE